ncbi:MAG: hypothetical protein IJQ97_04585, partial [Paludibacteraceae bacterium]|nr:hypothetical protein [Paludibacteraceae bacterium]
ERISKQELSANLNRVLGADVGIKGLNTLIHGWLKHRRYGHSYYEALRHREWLYVTEVQDLSEYAGYDLAKLES